MRKCLAVIIFVPIIIILGCETAPKDLTSLTPTEIFKLQDEATRKKDIAAIKQTLTKDSIEMMTATAKKAGLTFEEFIKKIPDNPAKPTFEFRNEVIEGDTAKIEVKSSQKNIWLTSYFRKEDGMWKVDMVKSMTPANK